MRKHTVYLLYGLARVASTSQGFGSFNSHAPSLDDNANPSLSSNSLNHAPNVPQSAHNDHTLSHPNMHILQPLPSSEIPPVIHEVVPERGPLKTPNVPVSLPARQRVASERPVSPDELPRQRVNTPGSVPFGHLKVHVPAELPAAQPLSQRHAAHVPASFHHAPASLQRPAPVAVQAEVTPATVQDTLYTMEAAPQDYVQNSPQINEHAPPATYDSYPRPSPPELAQPEAVIDPSQLRIPERIPLDDTSAYDPNQVHYAESAENIPLSHHSSPPSFREQKPLHHSDNIPLDAPSSDFSRKANSEPHVPSHAPAFGHDSGTIVAPPSDEKPNTHSQRPLSFRRRIPSDTPPLSSPPPEDSTYSPPSALVHEELPPYPHEEIPIRSFAFSSPEAGEEPKYHPSSIVESEVLPSRSAFASTPASIPQEHKVAAFPDEVGFMTVDPTNFDAMTLPEKIRHFEVEGYVVFPGILDNETIARIKHELADAQMAPTSYSEAQTRSTTQPQWLSPAVCELVGFEPMVQFLEHLLGPDIVFTRGFYQKTLHGSPGISLHTDGQPHGSNLFGFEGSSPRLLRVLYYLDELTPERGPFRIVPRSHLSFHADASPYLRYKSHPEEVTLLLPAGSAVVVPALVFHGSHAQKDPSPRELVQLGYRPGWAGPIQMVDEWDPDLLATVPPVSRPFFQSPNKSGFQWEQSHKPAGMRSDSEGIRPSRWLKEKAIKQDELFDTERKSSRLRPRSAHAEL